MAIHGMKYQGSRTLLWPLWQPSTHVVCLHTIYTQTLKNKPLKFHITTLQIIIINFLQIICIINICTLRENVWHNVLSLKPVLAKHSLYREAQSFTLSYLFGDRDKKPKVVSWTPVVSVDCWVDEKFLFTFLISRKPVLEQLEDNICYAKLLIIYLSQSHLLTALVTWDFSITEFFHRK